MSEDLLLVVMAFGLLFFTFVIGCCIGSFLNVVILRAFSGESIVLPPSKCPKCGNKLKWWHNIPILSYVFLRGKCGFCHEKISIQYPIVEFISGCLFVLILLRYGWRIDTLFAFATASLLIVLAVTDIKEKVVFDSHTYSLIGVGLAYNLTVTGMSVYQQMHSLLGFAPSKEWILTNPLTMSLLGIIVGFVVMEIVARIGYLIAGQRAFGEGDSYIAAGLGAVFGWKSVLTILVLSVIIQIVMTLPLFLVKLYSNKKWNTLAALVCFFGFTVGYCVLKLNTDIFSNNVFLYLSMIILTGLGIWACISVISGLKDRDNLTYLPFGPAMAIAGLLMLIVLNAVIPLPF